MIWRQKDIITTRQYRIRVFYGIVALSAYDACFHAAAIYTLPALLQRLQRSWFTPILIHSSIRSFAFDGPILHYSLSKKLTIVPLAIFRCRLLDDDTGRTFTLGLPFVLLHKMPNMHMPQYEYIRLIARLLLN